MSRGYSVGLVLIVVSSLCTSYAVDIVENYNISLTSNGPAVLGTTIDFQARLLLGTGAEIKDRKFFKYEWHSTDDYKKTQTADFNTTLQRCYGFFSGYPPGVYKMAVTVFDTKRHEIVARGNHNYTVTATLNGNLNAMQNLTYRHRNNTNMFATNKPVHLRVNITDRLAAKPVMKYSWSVNGTTVITKTPNFTMMFLKPGKHKVHVFVISNSTITDCNEESVFWNNWNGTFQTTVDFKDPVGTLKVRAKSDFLSNETISATIYYNGSSPFWPCWSLTPESNTSLVLNGSCSPDSTEDAYLDLTSFNPGPGRFVLIFNVSNDVSEKLKHHYIVIHSDANVQPHSAADILLPVIGALIAVTVVLSITVYAVNLRNKQRRNVETANHDFLPSLPLAPEQERGTIATEIKNFLKKVFKRSSSNSDEAGRKFSDSGVHSDGSMRNYGSIET